MLSERIKRLKQASENSVPSISMERAQAVTRTYQEFLGKVSIPILRANAFLEIMRSKTIYIGDDELIVGERGERPMATPTFPELCCHTLEDFDVMNRREKITFSVTEQDRQIQEKGIIPFWHERATRHILLNTVDQNWLDAYEAGVFTEFMEQRGPGHTAGDDKYFKSGFLQFKDDIATARQDLDFLTDPEAPTKEESLKAMEIACDALILQGDRYAAEATRQALTTDDLTRKAELLEIARVCRKVPRYAPETLHEALQMYWFVHIGVISELNPWDAFNPGRLDQHLFPFYEKGLEEGSLCQDSAIELIQCLWIKFNNHPAPPKVGITLKESSTYFDFATINLGGLTDDGEDGVNELSYILLDVIKELRLLQPGSNVQISQKTPQSFLKHAIDVTRTGYGQPSIFNADMVIEELLEAGKSLEDARQGGTSGCVETGAFGKEAYILTGYFNLPKILELTLNNGVEPLTKKQLGPKTGEASSFTSYNELFEAYRAQLRYFIEVKVKGNMRIGDLFSRVMPVPFLSVLIDDCIKNGRDYNAGGARYNTTYIQGVGLANITDSLAVIKTHIFEKSSFTMDELLQALVDNFEGHERIYHLVNNRTPKYGNDDTDADAIMRAVFDSYYGEVTGRPAPRNGVHRVNMLPTTCHIYFGSMIGALPEGRLAHEPLADGISPARSADRRGPTAVVNSAAKMPHRLTGGTLLNQKFTPQVASGETGLSAMAGLVRGYFRQGGHHVQFNVVDRATLIDAQQNPKDYANLIVRVAGYSDYFNNLDSALQNEIIRRTEQTL
ncbi:MAG TPA: trans-4-hydroxy-L-proline dehydratase [Clostridia bacterium]|nr:trans-4-hydroxy-L-proline dehydratase [Clostridia bacterium]